MYKYQVKVFDKTKNFPYDVIVYETITADGYCAELEARKMYPNAKIGEVTRTSNYIKDNPNV